MYPHSAGFLSGHIQSTGFPVMPGAYSPFFPHSMPVYSVPMHCQGFPATYASTFAPPVYNVNNPVVDAGVKAVISGFQERGVTSEKTSAALSTAFNAVSAPNPVRPDGVPAETGAESKCPFMKEMYERAYAGPLRLMSPAQQQAFKQELAKHVTPEAVAKCPFLSEMGIAEELAPHKAPHPMPGHP